MPGKGSTFTLVIPFDGPRTAARRAGRARHPAALSLAPAGLIGEPLPEFADDRDRIMPGDRVVLVVEDDPTFGGLLLGLARSAGLKGVLSTAGSGTLALARKLMPDAITLDLGLSDIDGWVLFDLLRHDPKTSGVPIHVISGADDLDTLVRKGATSVSTKPVSSDELPCIRGHPQQQAAHAAQCPGRRRRSGPAPVVDRRDPRRRHLGDGYRRAWPPTPVRTNSPPTTRSCSASDARQRTMRRRWPGSTSGLAVPLPDC